MNNAKFQLFQAMHASKFRKIPFISKTFQLISRFSVHQFFCMFSVFVQGAEVLQSAKLYGSLKAALTGTGGKCMEVA